MYRLCSILTILIVAAGAHPASAAERKKLIEFGWDEPDTAFMRKHAAEMERTPFDGCVFHVEATRADGKREGFTWQCWGTRAFTEVELQLAIDDLRAAGFTRFTENFLRFNVTPGKVDWFDDFGPIVSNARLAARVAREGKCRGVLFDIEQYEARLWNYEKLRDAKTKSWDEYAAQVRQRGREVMKAFQEGYPGLTVFLTFAYSLPNAQSGGDPAKLAKADYGLLAPFLDGMIDAADVNSGVKIVDGCELAYGYKEPAQFAKAARTMRTGVLPLVKADHAKYGKVISVGFGVWMDNNWRKVGWDLDHPEKNYFPPDAFGHSVAAALAAADEYVWVYTEQPRWWSEAGGPVKVPEAYAEALKRAAGREPAAR